MEIIILLVFFFFEMVGEIISCIFGLIGSAISAIFDIVGTIIVIIIETVQSIVSGCFSFCRSIKEYFMPTHDKEQFRRRMTNLLGVLVLATFVLAVLATKAAHWFENQKKKGETLNALNEVAHGFASHDEGAIFWWASGLYHDAWGNGLVLTHNDRKTVQFRSKGPDGELFTADDLGSDLVAIQVRHYDPVVKSSEKPVWREIIDSNRDRITEQAKNLRWKVEWHWGKAAKENADEQAEESLE